RSDTSITNYMPKRNRPSHSRATTGRRTARQAQRRPRAGRGERAPKRTLAELPAMRQARDAHLTRASDHAELQALLVLVVVAVLWVDDADVHVEGAGEQSKLVDREPRDAFGRHGHGDPIHERVRAVHAGAVLAVDVHAEDRVGHALRVAEPDLDRRRHPRFEDDALVAVGTEHARARDLDLLRAPARTDLAAFRAL